MIAKKPTNINPYKILLDKNCTWLPRVKSTIEHIVDDAKKVIQLEAEYEGQPELANEKFLYQQFKSNVEYDMHIGNWKIFKFFSAYFRIKIYEDMIGNWLFTNNDVEMYNHFASLKITDENKCTVAKLNFKMKTETEHWILDNPFINWYFYNLTDWCLVRLKPVYSTDRLITYSTLWDKPMHMHMELIKKVKGLRGGIIPFNNFFTTNEFYCTNLNIDLSPNNETLNNALQIEQWI